MQTFSRYSPFVRGIRRSPVDSLHKGQWRGALMFSLFCLNKRPSKQSRRRWFWTPWRPLWLSRGRYQNLNSTHLYCTIKLDGTNKLPHRPLATIFGTRVLKAMFAYAIFPIKQIPRTWDLEQRTLEKAALCAIINKHLKHMSGRYVSTHT